ncbi:MAG: hypothetical protein ABIL78_04815 [candidate division WOR-3 bacterium]
MAQKSIQGNFLKILEKAIIEKFTGSLVFLGPNGGIVRVVLIDGKIKHIDSTWGYGKNELEKIKIWNSGTCLIKTLTQKDKETFSKMPDIEYEIEVKESKPTTKPTIIIQEPKTTKLLPYMILDGSPETFEEIINEIQDSVNTGGFVKIKPSNNVIVFYKGKILSSFSGFPPSEKMKNYYALKQLIENQNQVLLYNFEQEVAYALVSLFVNKILISGIDASSISIEEIIEDCKLNLFNGVIWVDGDLRILIDFEMGEIKRILKIDEIIKFVDFPSTLDLKFSKIYKFSKIPEGELMKLGVKILTQEKFNEFLKGWNRLNLEIVNKIGKKVAQKTFEKVLANSEFSDLFQVKDGILKLIALDKNPYLLFEAFVELTSSAINEIDTFIGGNWVKEKLSEFYNREKEIIQNLEIEEVLKEHWRI